MARNVQNEEVNKNEKARGGGFPVPAVVERLSTQVGMADHEGVGDEQPGEYSDQSYEYLKPAWWEHANRGDLAALTEIARRSRDWYTRVSTCDEAKDFTVGPVNSEAFGAWLSARRDAAWPREWTHENACAVLEALQAVACEMTSQELQESLANAGCWCHPCDPASGGQFRPEELVTPTPDHVMSKYGETWEHWTAVGYAIHIKFDAWLQVLLECQAPFCFVEWAYIPISSCSAHDSGDLIPVLPFAVFKSNLEGSRLCVAYGANPLAETQFYCGNYADVLSMADVSSPIYAALTAPPGHAVAAVRALIWTNKFGVGNELWRRVDRNVVQIIARMVFESRNAPVWRALCKTKR
jgi:hypothetical protein